MWIGTRAINSDYGRRGIRAKWLFLLGSDKVVFLMEELFSFAVGGLAGLCRQSRLGSISLRFFVTYKCCY